MAGLSRFVQQLGRQERFGLGWTVSFCFMIFLAWTCILFWMKTSEKDIIDYIVNASIYHNISGENIIDYIVNASNHYNLTEKYMYINHTLGTWKSV